MRKVQTVEVRYQGVTYGGLLVRRGFCRWTAYLDPRSPGPKAWADHGFVLPWLLHRRIGKTFPTRRQALHWLRGDQP